MSHVIALVDDDRNILTSVSIALQAEGFVTRVYTDGETALKAFADNPPDMGVFDIKMPSMDGMELLRRVRELGHDVGAMPVIFLTSKDDELDERRRGQIPVNAGRGFKTLCIQLVRGGALAHIDSP